MSTDGHESRDALQSPEVAAINKSAIKPQSAPELTLLQKLQIQLEARGACSRTTNHGGSLLK